MKKKRFLLLGLFLTAYLSAHEGHDMPGAMPPAPHGGEVKEVGHKEEDAHGHETHAEGEEEAEIFFEVVYSNKTIKVYPLTVSAKNPKIFTAFPINALSDVSLKAELPRQKRTENLKVKTTETHFEAPFDPKLAFRFFTIVSVKHESEKKEAKVQVEIE